MKNPDVIIVGGGIIGLSIADRLAADDVDVMVLERGVCGQEASWAGAGILSPCSWHRRDDLARIHMDAIFRYHDFVADIHERSSFDPEFNRCEALKMIRDDNRMKMAVNEVAAVGDRTTPEGRPIVQTLSVEQARQLEPALTAELLGVQHCRMTAQIRNPRLLQALCTACGRRGVTIEEGVEVRGLLREGSTVLGVDTAAGPRHAAMTVIAGGAWSARLDPILVEQAPIYPVRGQMILMHQNPPSFTRVIEEGNFYMVVRRDGHILIGATEEHDTGFVTRTTAGGLNQLSQRALALVPQLADGTIVRTWAGLRPGTPDRRPYMGRIDGLEGVVLCSGHFRTGLTTAPVVAEIARDLVTSSPCPYDLTRCAPGRKLPDPDTDAERGI